MYLKEIQVNKTKQLVFLLDENYEVMGKLECSTDFYPGFNDVGQPHDSPDDGVYRETVWCDIDWPDEDDLSPVYGYAYLNLDTRGRALHGGGSVLGEKEALRPFQKCLTRTEGCIRMYNADVWWMCQHWRRSVAAGLDPCVHVVS